MRAEVPIVIAKAEISVQERPVDPSPSAKSTAEITHDLRDIHEQVTWMQPSADAIVLLKEIIRQLASMGTSQFLDDMGIDDLSDMSCLDDMSLSGIMDLLDEALISVPAETMTWIGRHLLPSRSEALVRVRQRMGSDTMIDYEEGFQSGCTGKQGFPDEAAAEAHRRANPHWQFRALYRCRKCHRWHLSRHFEGRFR
jgi:hypothetical protein